ncbi:MAG: MotA/TolQ/ExbB proton channel family protein [Spirochaetales bacterium]|nr:MotA/TolQ/ExbB proton channel family protein [Spirochaetales bacterium]
MIETLKSGGLLMIPIIFCGIFATFIIIERCVYFYTIKKKDLKLMSDLDGSIRAGNYEACAVACAQADTPMSQVIKKAVDCRYYQEQDLREAVEAEMDFVVPRLEHWLTPLGTIANISTLLGLLGTVTGNIKAFGILGSGGTMGDPSLLAGAIAEALVTTVAGLCVSIPSVIFHNFFNSRVNHRLVEMESDVTSVLLRLTGRVS